MSWSPAAAWNAFPERPAQYFLGRDGRLPAGDGPEDGLGKSEAAAAARSAVLVVDDSEQDLTLLDAAFRFSGVKARMRWADSAQAARSYFLGQAPFQDRAANPLPNLVLLDIQLGDEDGFSVLKWLRAQKAPWRQVPVVMLTTSQDRDEVSRAYDLGANSFLTKPTGFDELCSMAADLNKYWLARNKQP
jgi:CheY-like chemotaxis protein